MPKLLVLLTTFLVTPPALGRTEPRDPPRPERSLAAWTNRMFAQCVDEFGRHLDLPGPAARVVADRLCAHGRVFWPFVEMRDVAAFERLRPFSPEDKLPLVISVTGASAQLNSRAMHAVRRVLYPGSTSLLNLNAGPSAFARWRRTHGRLGGVVYVTIDGLTAGDRDLQTHRARDAVAALSDEAWAGYVLMIDARADHAVNPPGGLRLNLDPCASGLADAR